MNIPALEANADEIERQIARLETELEAKRLELRLTRNDIAAARLQAWYRDNPGIELVKGEKLSSSNGLDTYTVRRVLINHFDDQTNCFVEALDEVDMLSTFSMDTARRMRQAWLAQETQS